MAAAWSKLEETAARLALVLHLARWAASDPTLENGDLVDSDSMESAIRLTQWFKGEARRVYAMLHGSGVDGDRRRLIEWVRGKGGTVTARDAQQGCRWLKSPGAAQGALDELARHGLGRWMPSPAGRPGQPTRLFKLALPQPGGDNTHMAIRPRITVDVDGGDAPHAESQDGRLFAEPATLPD